MQETLGLFLSPTQWHAPLIEAPLIEAWEVNARGSEVQGHPQLHIEFQASLGFTGHFLKIAVPPSLKTSSRSTSAKLRTSESSIAIALNQALLFF